MCYDIRGIFITGLIKLFFGVPTTPGMKPSAVADWPRDPPYMHFLETLRPHETVQTFRVEPVSERQLGEARRPGDLVHGLPFQEK